MANATASIDAVTINELQVEVQAREQQVQPALEDDEHQRAAEKDAAHVAAA